MKKLLVAALMVVLASPAFAAIQNVKVSGDITTSWLDNTNFDLGRTTFTPGVGWVAAGQKNQNVFLTQTRLRVDADLSDNVSTTVGLINERAWNAEGSIDLGGNTPTGYDTNVQLYLASVTLREFLYSPLTLQIGRQVFAYGNGFILGDGGPVNSGSGNLVNIYADLNERTAYDGVTATLDYKPLTISMIYFKNGQTSASVQGLGHLTSGQSSDVYGINANYQLSDPMNTVVEGYLFSRINGSGYDALGAGADKANTLYVPGLRASTNPIKGLNLQGEVAWQLGNNEVDTTNNGNVGPQVAEGERRSAMAAQVLASYALPVMDKYKPTVNASYTYVSGDKNNTANSTSNPGVSSAKVDTAWDEFNTIQGAGTIYRSIFTMTNEHIASVGATVNPLEDVTLGATWSGLWSVDSLNSNNSTATFLQPDGTSVSPAVKAGASYLGNETDVNVTYNYTEDVTFGVNAGWFVPGSVFTKANNETASQVIANVGVKF